MSEIKLVPFDRAYPNLQEVFDIYEASFPDEERKPFEMILSGIEQQIMKGLVAEKEGKPIGLAFSILSDPGLPVILDYLAIEKSFQNQGYGSFLLQALKKESDFLVEIESTRKGDLLACRRKDFYLQNGLLENGLEIELFGVEMEILSTRPVSFQAYFQAQADYLEKMKLPYEPERFIKER